MEPRKSNVSSGRRQKRVCCSFTVNFSLDIIVRITFMASSAVPRQQMTKSSAELMIRASRRFSCPPVFHPFTKRRMYTLANNGEIGAPWALPIPWSLFRVVRWRSPFASVSSTGASSHSLISRSTRPSLIRRHTDFMNSA